MRRSFVDLASSSDQQHANVFAIHAEPEFFRMDFNDSSDEWSLNALHIDDFETEFNYQAGLDAVDEGHEQLFVRTLREDMHDVVLDSGADVTVVPLSFCHEGSESFCPMLQLRDAQGGLIKSNRCRNLNFVFYTEDGCELQVGERAYLADVAHPLFSLSRLLKKGWELRHGFDSLQLVHTDGYPCVPVDARNSLLARAHIRAAQSEPCGAQLFELDAGIWDVNPDLHTISGVPDLSQSRSLTQGKHANLVFGHGVLCFCSRTRLSGRSLMASGDMLTQVRPMLFEPSTSQSMQAMCTGRHGS